MDLGFWELCLVVVAAAVEKVVLDPTRTCFWFSCGGGDKSCKLSRTERGEEMGIVCGEMGSNLGQKTGLNKSCNPSVFSLLGLCRSEKYIKESSFCSVWKQGRSE